MGQFSIENGHDHFWDKIAFDMIELLSFAQTTVNILNKLTAVSNKFKIQQFFVIVIFNTI